MTRFLSTCALLGLLFAVTGCGSAPEGREPSSVEDDTTALAFEGTGVITRILPNTQLVEVRHGDIDGFMAAMTMPFEYREESVIDGFVVGDSIAFIVNSTTYDAWITEAILIERPNPGP